MGPTDAALIPLGFCVPAKLVQRPQRLQGERGIIYPVRGLIISYENDMKV